MKMKKLVVILMVLAVGSVAQAVPVTFEFSGVITDVYDPEGTLNSSIVVDSLFNCAYTFDSDLIDSNPDERWGRYNYSQPAPDGFSMSATVAGEIFESVSAGDYSGSINVDNVTSGKYPCRYQVGSPINPQGFDSAVMELFVYGNSGFLDSDALPVIPPDLEQATYNHFSICYRPDRRDPFAEEVHIYGTISSLTLASVPEPATVALLGFGALSLLRKRRA